jgi:hypothetical protein
MIVSFYSVWGFLRGLFEILWCLWFFKGFYGILWSIGKNLDSMIFGELGYYCTMSVTNFFCQLRDLYDLDDTPFYFLKVVSWVSNVKERQL